MVTRLQWRQLVSSGYWSQLEGNGSSGQSPDVRKANKKRKTGKWELLYQSCQQACLLDGIRWTVSTRQYPLDTVRKMISNALVEIELSRALTSISQRLAARGQPSFTNKIIEYQLADLSSDSMQPSFGHPEHSDPFRIAIRAPVAHSFLTSLHQPSCSASASLSTHKEVHQKMIDYNPQKI